MNLIDYEKYYHSGSEFIIPRDEFEKIIEENQRLKFEAKKYKDLKEKTKDNLSSKCFELEMENAELREENQRLNNVLNELEKYFDKEFAHCLNYSEWTNGWNSCIDKHKSNILNKLKESDK
jgi:predicted nuclease with TOPRIM domain